MLSTAQSDFEKLIFEKPPPEMPCQQVLLAVTVVLRIGTEKAVLKHGRCFGSRGILIRHASTAQHTTKTMALHASRN